MCTALMRARIVGSQVVYDNINASTSPQLSRSGYSKTDSSRKSGCSSPIRLERKTGSSDSHNDVKPTNVSIQLLAAILDSEWRKIFGTYAAQIKIGTGVLVLERVAITALVIPIRRLKATLMPFPVALCAEGITSGVYA